MFPKSFGSTSGILWSRARRNSFAKEETRTCRVKDGPSVFTFKRLHALPDRSKVSARQRDSRGQRNAQGKSSVVGVLFFFKCKNATQDCRNHTQSSESRSEEGVDRHLCSLHNNSLSVSSRILGASALQEFKHRPPAKTTLLTFIAGQRQLTFAPTSNLFQHRWAAAAVPMFTIFFCPFPAFPPLFHLLFPHPPTSSSSAFSSSSANANRAGVRPRL